MGKVYQITFPNNKFYIGHTIRPLRARIGGHLTDPSNKKKMCLIDAFDLYSLDSLMDITSIIYEGSISKFIEIKMIYDNKDNPLCINGIYSPTKPVFMEWAKRKLPEYSKLYDEGVKQ